MDTDGNLDIGVVGADGGAVTRLTDAREVDLEPAWSRDSQDVFFVSARGSRLRHFQAPRRRSRR